MLNKTATYILDMLKENELVSRKQLAAELCLNSGTIDYYIRKLNAEGYKVDKVHRNKTFYFALNGDSKFKNSEVTRGLINDQV